MLTIPTIDQSSTGVIRLFLVDDEPTVRRGLDLLIGRQPDLLVCGEAGTAAEALAQIPSLAPDVAIVDLGLRLDDGFGLLRKLRELRPKMRLLVFSLHDDVSSARAAFESGAQGYVTKYEGTERVLDAIRSLMARRVYLSPAMAARMPKPRPCFP